MATPAHLYIWAALFSALVLLDVVLFGRRCRQIRDQLNLSLPDPPNNLIAHLDHVREALLSDMARYHGQVLSKLAELESRLDRLDRR